MRPVQPPLPHVSSSGGGSSSSNMLHLRGPLRSIVWQAARTWLPPGDPWRRLATAPAAAAAAAAASAPPATGGKRGASSSSSSGGGGGAAKARRKSQADGGSGAAAAAAAAADSGDGSSAGGEGGGGTLMIVESPAKAAKISKFLAGRGFTVLASHGHVRDLPERAGAVRPDEGFAMEWRVPPRGAARLAELAAAAARSARVLLATDPDREGEAIAWHIAEELRARGALPRGGSGSGVEGRRSGGGSGGGGDSDVVRRVAFGEVTKKAVEEALRSPRDVSAPLVDAYLARRGLDYLVGFTLSPVLWRRLSRAARSAGRVQSVALAMACAREAEVERFSPREYWTVTARLSADAASSDDSGSDGDGSVPARLTHADGDKLGPMAIADAATAEALAARVAAAPGWVVSSAASRRGARAPPPPFTTSTLQQEAARRLGWTTARTMQVAQALYEGRDAGDEGLITYMRTDGVTLAPEAVEALRAAVTAAHGPDYLPPAPRAYKTKTKNAQEAHEAIRPTDPGLSPDELPAALPPDSRRLYDLIWRRALACQMADAETLLVTVDVDSAPARDLRLRAAGTAVVFKGYLAAYDGAPYSAPSVAAAAAAAAASAPGGAADAGQASDAEGGAGGDVTDGEGGGEGAGGASSGGGAALSDALRALKEGDAARASAVSPNQHFTRAPARYNEGTLVRAMEAAGVGRPSTYAATVKLLLDRGYVVREGKALVPTPVGRVLGAFLQRFFSDVADAAFTARMEERLDEVSAGRAAWRDVLAGFWEGLSSEAARVQGSVSTTQVYDALDEDLAAYAFPPCEDGSDPRKCPLCGGRLVVKPHKACCAFVACSNYATTGCGYSRPLGPDALGDHFEATSSDDEGAGGGGGGGAGGGGTAGLLWNVRPLGPHPETGELMFVRKGPYGLYVQAGGADPTASAGGAAVAGSGANGAAADHGKAKAKAKPPKPRNAALPAGATFASVTVEQAVAALAGPRELGPHPSDGEPILLHAAGRFGPYVAHRTLLAPVPKGVPLDDLTLEQAAAAVDAKAARLAKRGQDPYAPRPSKGRKGAGAKAKGKAAGAAKAGRKEAGAGSGDGASSGGASSGGGGGTKRAASGYIAFGKANRQRLLDAAPGTTPKQAFALIAEAWRALSDEERARWNAEAKQQQQQQQE